MNKSINQEIVTFYDVPLVCGAAPSIGCGSRAKPLLLDLERQSAIKEVWLNRTGTMVAIVWRDEPRMEEAGKPVFKRHEVDCRERLADPQTTQSFPMEGSWLRSGDVDRLSLEEAQEIAETLVALPAKERLISSEEAARIKSEIEAYFRKELIKVRSKQELLDDTRGMFPEAVLDIYKKHVGAQRIAGVRALAPEIQSAFNRTDPEETSSCCS
jgi:hypothetical protein